MRKFVAVTFQSTFARCGLVVSFVLSVACGRIDYDLVEQRARDLGTFDSSTPDLGETPAANIVVTPTSGLTTSEAGASSTFTVVLTRQPTAAVAVWLSSSNLNEGTVAPSSLTFTSVNWNAPQVVTINGHDDSDADGPQAYTIVTGPAASADPAYSGLDPDDVSVVNLDNELASVVVTPTSGLFTSEAGATATFSVVLNRAPTANVSLTLASSDTDEATVAPGSLSFTTTDFASPQTVTVTGVDDLDLDGDQFFTISTSATSSSDPDFDALVVDNVSGTNTDDEIAGITVSPTSGLSSTESGGTATFSVVLTAPPSANVTVAIASSDTTEGTVSPASVTFTAGNWNLVQSVTVVGVDDASEDGNVVYTLLTSAAVSGDTHYSGIDPSDVTATNLDNDTAAVLVFPTSGITTSELGETQTFEVVLGAQPMGDVVIAVSSSDVTEGVVSSSGTLTFTAANWSAAQTVTVAGVSDAYIDGDQSYTIIVGTAASTDSYYNGINPADVSVVNHEYPCVTARMAFYSSRGSGGVGAFGVTQGDLNGDGELDLVLANLDDTVVSVVLGVGDGTFGVATNYAVGSAPYTSALGDFNRDGKLDIAVVNFGSSNVSVLLNSGAGTFAAPVNYVIGSSARDIRIGDLNNDGILDIVTADTGSDRVSVLLGQVGGVFAAAVGYSAGVYPYNVAIIDWNHDGRQDIIAANYLNDTISFLANTGGGVFAAPVATPTPVSGPISLGVAEFTGDAWPDLAVAYTVGSSLTLFHGNPSGAFATTTSSAAAFFARVLTIADFDGDGSNDVATLNPDNNNFSIFRNIGLGFFAAPVSYPLGATSFGMTSGDFDNDGDVDIAGTLNGASSVAVYLGSGGIGSDGTFETALDTPFGSDPEGLQIGDVDLDGNLDAVVANSGGSAITLRLGNGGGAFLSSSVSYAQPANSPFAVHLADFNGDSLLDLAYTLSLGVVRVQLNSGGVGINYAPAVDYTVAATPHGIASGDFNRDGRRDLAVANLNGASASVLLGTGTGAFAAAVSYMGFVGPTAITAADANNDGRLDLLATSTSGGLNVAQGSGTGTFGAVSNYLAGASPRGVAATDFNSDGRIDVVIADLTGDSVVVLLGNGAGAFAVSGTYAVGDGPQSVAAGDFNRDGRMDVACANSFTNTVSVLLGNGDGTLATAISYAAGIGPFAVAVSDFNHDGRSDISVTNAISGTVSTLIARRVCLP